MQMEEQFQLCYLEIEMCMHWCRPATDHTDLQHQRILNNKYTLPSSLKLLLNSKMLDMAFLFLSTNHPYLWNTFLIFLFS